MFAAVTGAVCGIMAAIPVAIFPTAEKEPSLPNFAEISDVEEKKKTFIAYIRPLIAEVNAGVATDREKIEKLRDRLRDGDGISRRERRWLNRVAKRYALAATERPTERFFKRLLLRVDRIPPSLVLAQAAKESAWGASRFAREGNNLFGIRCYTPGCGIVPRKRAPGARHEVKKYEDVGSCVEDYVSNLNTNQAYYELWRIRADLRARGESLSGYLLAKGLARYSSRGTAYVKEIQSLIRFNRLEDLD